jgi:hypothetical protein
MRRRVCDVLIRARALPVVAAAALALAAGGCGAAPGDVDDVAARRHIDRLAGAIGSRPAGSDAAARARDYLIDQLEDAGFAVRLQRAEAVDDSRGLTVPVVNIIASTNGAESGAIALVAHYDSSPDAAGALDDAIGVAVCLEAGRALARSARRHSLFVILTDGEELGMMGARAVIRDPEVGGRIRAFLNFDGTGAAGPPLLFEAVAGRDGGSALPAWASGAPDAAGGSFSTEIYRRLPNDTDFTIFRSLGVPGLNFAPVGDSYAYHTDRDTAPRVRIETVRQAIVNTVGIVRQIDRDGLAVAGGQPTYFDVAGLRGFTYGPAAAGATAWTAAALGTIAWVVVFGMVRRARGGAAVLATLAWALATAAITAVAMAGAGWGLAAGRDALHFWYAEPHWLFAATTIAGLLAWTAMSALARRVPARAAPLRAPHAVWWVALPVWIAITIALHLLAPAASYLTSLPLLCASAALIVARSSEARIRVASAIALVVSAHFWLADTLRLLSFMVPLFGWMGIVPPVWIFAALIAVALLMCGPPAAAIVAGRRPRATAMAVLAAAAAGLAALAAAAPAYTDDRPERRMLRYVQDDLQQRAWWEQGGPEPRAAVAGAAPITGEWQPVRAAPDTAVSVSPISGAFRFRADARETFAAPADVRARSAWLGDGSVELTIALMPKQRLSATLVLPPEVVPRQSSLSGRVSGGRWRATYVAPPPTGLDVRLVFDSRHAAALAKTAVVVTTDAVPDAAPGRRVPTWIPGGAITWQPRGLYVIRPAPEALTAAPSRLR